MKLLSLLIKNFRGIVELYINSQGKNVNIYGLNGTGKTTTEDSFLELLFGKDSADKKDYDLIPHIPGTTDPDVGSGKEPTIEGMLEYFGKVVKLKKIYAEEWPTKGELKGKYAGSKMHFYVDDIEVKSGEYQQVVSELVDDKLFKLITNPHHFSETLSWQERRETLVKIGGELNVMPVPALAELMGDRTFDKFFALAKQTVKEKQKIIDGMPFSITEAKRLIPAVLPAVPDINALTTQKTSLEEKLLSAKSDDSANAKRRAIADIETEILEARNRYNALIEADNSKIKKGIEKLENEKRDKEREAFNLNCDTQNAAEEIESLSIKKSRKLAEWHDANDRIWTGAETCPTCGQALPEDQIETARSDFNRQRSEDLERLKSEGLALKAIIEQKQSVIDSAQPVIETLNADIATLAARIENGRAMIKSSEFSGTDEFTALHAKIDALCAAPEDGSMQQKILDINTSLSDTLAQIDAAHRLQDQHKQMDDQIKHVDDLMDQQKQLNSELGKWEKAVSLCDQHVKKQAKALEQAVNGKFKIAHFRMFQMQKNGEEAECCDVIYPNGSTNLSTGERLQVGIDIINTLTEFYGVDAPIWADNYEGITLPVECISQIIRLYVSSEDKALRVEIGN